MRASADLTSGFLLLLTVWACLLCVPRALASLVGTEAATLVAFCLAAWLVLVTRRERRRRPWRRVACTSSLGVATGYASLPAWAAAIGALGLLLGLDTLEASRPGRYSSWIVTVGVAPVLEELLYRERLQSALGPKIGSPAAVLVSSALFALPHIEPWAVLGTFVVGIALGAMFSATGSIALCIGVHAGLNAAVRT